MDTKLDDVRSLLEQLQHDVAWTPEKNGVEILCRVSELANIVEMLTEAMRGKLPEAAATERT